MNCLQGFWEEKSRNEQVGYCKDNELVRIEMPHKKPVVEYSDEQFQFNAPLIMYADFESILKLISGPGNNPRISTKTSKSTFRLDGAFAASLLIIITKNDLILNSTPENRL